MPAELNDYLVSLSGRLSRDGKVQTIARFRNGRQQIYTLTPSTLPRSPSQLSNSSRFRTAVAIAHSIYHDPVQRAVWQEFFNQNPEHYVKLFNFILAKISRSENAPGG